MLTKLLFRTLPDHYPAGSAYAHFPFLDPVYMRENVAKDANLVKKYTWTRPKRLPATAVIDTFGGVKQILSGPHFMSAYNDRMFNITLTRSTVRSSEFWL
jgi:linoleate 10R-lipoxygenase